MIEYHWCILLLLLNEGAGLIIQIQDNTVGLIIFAGFHCQKTEIVNQTGWDLQLVL